MTNKDRVYNYLRSKGLSLAATCGIMANIQRESSYNPTAKGDSGTSFGLCQWHKTRWDKLKNYCTANKTDINSVEAQIDFMLEEMRTGYKSTYTMLFDKFNTAAGAKDIAYKMCVSYEIPANKTVKGEQRANLATDLYREYSGYSNSIQTAPGNDIIKNGLEQVKSIVEDMLNAIS